MIFEEDTGFIFAFLDKRIEFEFPALQVVDAMVAYAKPFFSAEVRPRDARLIVRLRVFAYDNRQIAREGVDMRGEKGTVLLVECRHARIHVHVILRHTGGQELAVAIQDVPSRRRNGFAGGHLFLRHFQPLVAFYGLDIDDFSDHGKEAAKDDREDDREAPNRISLFVRHEWLVISG